jgi:glucokinase
VTASPHVAALDIGGTHVTAALVDVTTWHVVSGSGCRREVDSAATADVIVAAIVDAAKCIGAPQGTSWGVAIPGPFDYQRGIGDFSDVGKFDALRGVDLGSLLRASGVGPDLHFLNDADAFGIGEWAAGAAAGHARVICVTLGTGVGSAFLVEGVAVHEGPGVPPEGRLDLLQIDGRPLEHTISRAAIRKRYAALATDPEPSPDVHEIAALASSGHAPARQALAEPSTELGKVLGPRVVAFGASVLVIGGAISGAWELVSDPLRAGMDVADTRWSRRCQLVAAQRVHDAALIGAAWSAYQRAPRTG